MAPSVPDQLSVCMVDPTFSMFHYEVELLGALHPLVADLALWAPPVIRDTGYPLPASMPRIQGVSLHRFADKKETILGRSVWGYEYYANELYSLIGLLLRNPKPLVHLQFLSLFADSPLDDRWLAQIKKAAAKLVYTVHNVLPHDNEADTNIIARYRRVYHLADHLVAHTDYQRLLLIEQFAVDPERITVIPHGPLFHRLQLPDRAVAKKRHNLDGAEPCLLHFGRMRPYKGTEVAIDAMGQVLRHYPDARLILAGAITSDRAQHLQAMIHDRGLDSHVHLHFGFVPTETLADYFALADAVVLPYLKIDQSGVLLSALALGLPVIASDAGGVSETVRAHDLGYLVPVADSEALAESILLALSDEVGTSAKVERAQNYVRQNLSWETIAAQTVQLYRRVLNQ